MFIYICNDYYFGCLVKSTSIIFEPLSKWDLLTIRHVSLCSSTENSGVYSPSRTTKIYCSSPVIALPSKSGFYKHSKNLKFNRFMTLIFYGDDLLDELQVSAYRLRICIYMYIYNIYYVYILVYIYMVSV